MCRSLDAPEWMSPPRVVCLGLRLIVDGALDRAVEGDLAGELGVSGRHLRRMFNDHLGITPNRLAQANRLRRAARLLSETEMAVADVAYRAGFGSIRQFNRACSALGTSPIGLRGLEDNHLVDVDTLTLRFTTSVGFVWAPIAERLRSTAVPHVEYVDSVAYRRVVVVGGIPGALEVSVPSDGQMLMRVHLNEWLELLHVVQRARSTVDPDGVDQETIQSSNVSERAEDSLVVGPRIPGLPRVWDPFELVVNATLTAHLPESHVKAATSLLIDRYGTPVQTPIHPLLTRSFPSADKLAESDLRDFGLGSSVQDALRRVAMGFSRGLVPLTPSTDMSELKAALVGWCMIDEACADHIATRIGMTIGESLRMRSANRGDHHPVDDHSIGDNTQSRQPISA